MRMRNSRHKTSLDASRFGVRLAPIFFGLCLLLWLQALVPELSFAARTINSVTLNGGLSVSVDPSATIAAVVSVTTDGGGSNNDWLSTSWRIGAGAFTCVDHGNHTSSGSYSESFNITAPAAAGIYDVDFIAYNDNNCSSGASLTFSRGGAVSVRFPAVSAITRASADPTTANSSVAWTVLFTQSVTGVDAADFALVMAGGASGAMITAVAGSGTTWTVTAHTGTANTGTLGLDLTDNDSIVNGGIPLGGAGIGNGSYVGQIYTLAPPAPVLKKTASAAAAVVGDVVTFTLTASNPHSAALSNVVVTDTLPAGMSYGSHVTTLGSAVVAGQIVTWTIAALPASGSAQLTLAVRLSQQGLVTNTVSSPGSTSATSSILVLASAVTHFRMDEPVGSWTGAAGEVIDSGGTALHGRRLTSTTPTTTNVVDPATPIWSQHPSVVGGFCNAASFDGRAIVEVADSPLFDYTTKLSASAWIYPTAYPPSGGLYSVLSNDVNYEFHLNSSGKLFWWWNASTLTSATTIPLNRWTHVAITFDSSSGVRRQRIYINGVQDTNTNSWQGSLAVNNCNFYVGGDVSTGAACSIMAERNFRGLIDEVKLYSFELNAAEVVADMTLGRACSGSFDHVRIEHDGIGSICAPERVTVKACLDPSCTTLYPGNVTVNLAPTGWVGGDTFTFSGGIGTRQLSHGTPGSITFGTNSVSPTPASSSRCFIGATESCTMTFAAASCAFDAVETGKAPQTPIYTKLAGVPFNLDVLALLSATSINTTYTGTVTVDLVDTTSSVCPTGSGLNTAADILFGGSDVGRKPVTFNYPNAARNVRVRAKVGSSAPACSTDNFAIRPQAFAISSADATNPATSGGPVIQAGTPFNLQAASVPGYDGTPLLDNSKVSGTPNAGVLGGSFTAAAVATGMASASDFTYSEVGQFGLGQNAVYDGSFTTVDQPDDCTPGYANVLAGGKYGCSTGSAEVPLATGSSGFGRFIPHHFLLNGVPTLTNRSDLSCTPVSDFTYQGEPFRIQFGLEAQNAANGRTTNYAGAYAKLDPTSTAPFHFGAVSPGSATPLTARLDLGIPPSGIWIAGLGGFTVTLGLNRGVAPDGPFDDLELGIAPLDTDGVAYRSDALNLDANLDAVAERARLATTQLRYGRLSLANAYGSELIGLPAPWIAEYYVAGGFSLHAADSCTPLTTAGALQLSSDGGTTWLNGDAAVPLGGGTTSASLASSPLVGGDAGLTFSAPGAGNTGTVEVRSNIASTFPWLLFDWNGDGTDDEAQSRITFGIYQGSPRLIYTRETVQ